MAWDVLGWLLSGEREEEKEEEIVRPLSAKDLARYDALKEIQKLKPALAEAIKTIEKAIQEEKDWETKRMLEKIYDKLETGKKGDFPSAVLLIHLAAAIQQGLHKDPEKLAQYLIKAADASARAILKRIRHPHKIGRAEEYYDITSYYHYLDALTSIFMGLSNLPGELGDKYFHLIRKIKNQIEPHNLKIAENVWAYEDMLDELFKKHFDWWDQTPEQILGIEEKMEKAGEEVSPVGGYAWMGVGVFLDILGFLFQRSESSVDDLSRGLGYRLEVVEEFVFVLARHGLVRRIGGRIELTERGRCVARCLM